MTLSHEVDVAAFGDYLELDDGTKLYCRHDGIRHDGPPVLLLHGNRDNHSHFAELAQRLSRSYHTVAVDFRGHGLSSKRECPLTLERLVADVLALCDHRGYDRVVLCGHSLGSVVGMLVAHERPGLVTRMVLMGTAATFELKFKRPPAPDDEAAFAALIDDANRRAAPLFFHPHHPEVAARVTACWSTITPAAHRGLTALRHPDLRGVVEQIAPRALLIAGEHDRCTTPDQARWMHAHLPDSELFVVPDTAHFMYLEEPDLVASRVLRFLEAER